jgi:hypothetical protein
LEGLRPSKYLYFLVLYAGKAGIEHEKKEIFGRQAAPKTPTAYVALVKEFT